MTRVMRPPGELDIAEERDRGPRPAAPPAEPVRGRGSAVSGVERPGRYAPTCTSDGGHCRARRTIKRLIAPPDTWALSRVVKRAA